MNYEAKEWKALAEGLLFDFGHAILGERSLVAKLYHKLGLDQARRVLRAAATKSDPREYIGAVIATDQQRPAMSEEEFARLKAKLAAKEARNG